jgi:hypothetical protein
MRKNLALCIALLFAGTVFCYSADLTITAEDVRVVLMLNNNETDGYHLFVRKKTDVQSVMLVETTRDPALVQTNYAYRALEWNAINGNETRYLNGEPLTDDYNRFSIIDSTPELDEEFGSAFHLFIPFEMTYGYPWTRNGIVRIGQDTFINIRAFGAQYGDYMGGFVDNPFTFDFPEPPPPAEPPVLLASFPDPLPAEVPPPVTELPIPQSVSTENYNPEAVASYTTIANANNGNLFYSNGPAQLTDDIIQSVHAIPDKTRADIIFAVDATGSMKTTMSHLRRELKARLKEEFELFGPVRVGLVFYRDYGDNFNFEGLPVKMFPFTSDLDAFNKNLDSIVITGIEGGDRPEAIFEAIYTGLNFYPWNDSTLSRKIIVVGDAEPHPTPRGTKQYSSELVQLLARHYNVTIDMIVLPETKGASAQ